MQGSTCKTRAGNQGLRADTQVDTHFLGDYPEVCEIIKRWPSLPRHIKVATLALVGVDSKGDHDAS
jgi:hypothetical protein